MGMDQSIDKAHEAWYRKNYCSRGTVGMGMDQSFDKAHEAWFEKHYKASSGDRRLQLERRASSEDGEEVCAETRFLRDVWWPVFGDLEMLAPEYEVVDGLGKTRFPDHAIVRYPVLVDLEVDGYVSHQKEASRWSFADDRRRDAGLRILGWDVLRIALSDIRDHPYACQEMLRRWMEAVEPRETLKDEQLRRMISFGMFHSPFTLHDIMRLLRTTEYTSRKLLKELLDLQVLLSVGTGEERVTSYKLNEHIAKGLKPKFLKF